jgi:hypothetical protein
VNCIFLIKGGKLESFGSISHTGSPEKIDRNVRDALVASGITAVVSGHQPFGDGEITYYLSSLMSISSQQLLFFFTHKIFSTFDDCGRWFACHYCGHELFKRPKVGGRGRLRCAPKLGPFRRERQRNSRARCVRSRLR